MTVEPAEKADVLVRPLGRRDLAFAAALHARSLPHGLFPRLGERFLRRYYATFVRSPWAVALLAESGGRPIGTLVGTADDRAHYRFVARRCWLPLVGAGLRSLAVQPGVAWWFLRTRGGRYARGLVRLARGNQTGSGEPGSAGPVRREGVLTHVAVDEQARGSGAGGELVTAFTAWAGSRGTSHLRLVTHGTEGAAAFYERLGWTVSGRRKGLDGGMWTELRLDLE